MSDYIKRSDILARFVPPEGVTVPMLNVSVESIVSLINSIPSADVAPVRRGKWIPHIEEDYIGEGQYGYIELLKCSECGTPVPNKRNFCHHCGAEMRGD